MQMFHLSLAFVHTHIHVISHADDVEVVSVRQVARRTLAANVTATLGVDVPQGATGQFVVLLGHDAT
jgi:hypothetical protein